MYIQNLQTLDITLNYRSPKYMEEIYSKQIVKFTKTLARTFEQEKSLILGANIEAFLPQASLPF